MRAFVFANGDGTRWANKWEGQGVKQLVDIDGTPLIHRTVRQLKERGWDVWVVAKNEDLRVDGAEFWTPPEPSGFLAESVRHTRDLWKGRTAFVLGDVYFSESAMGSIASAVGMQWFGRDFNSHLTTGTAEMFAWVLETEHFEMFEKALDAGIKNAYETVEEWDKSLKDTGSRAFAFRPGAICPTYEILLGREPQTPVLQSPVFQIVSDWTEDFDTPDSYEEWSKRYSRRWIGDKGRWPETEPSETSSAK